MKIRYYNARIDRDPNKYLGIDEHPIPLSLFVGVKHRPLAMISNTKTPYGVQFIINSEKEEVSLVTDNGNAYVSREDIEDVDEWFFIGEPMEEYVADTSYDSTADTLLHIKRVSQLLTEAASELIKRANVHDNSKLKSPEKEFFDMYTPRLKGSTYGSEEYQYNMGQLKVALDHHYKNNSHHPEHYENGVNDMDLFDLMEMFFDWKAATERHEDGNIIKSIEINQERFGISEQISDIFRNTVKRYL